MNSRRTASSAKLISISGFAFRHSWTQPTWVNTFSSIHFDWKAIKQAFVNTAICVINIRMVSQLPITHLLEARRNRARYISENVRVFTLA